jgi:predicted TIM-barrel fold metal-dependent hydrolase
MKIIDFHIHYMPRSVPEEKMLAAMDLCTIEKSLVLATPEHPRYLSMELTGTNEQVLSLCRRHPERFIPACYIEPRNVMEAQTQIRKFHDAGVRWLKIWPGHGFSPDEAMLYPVWEVVNELGMGMILHCGSLGVRTELPLSIRRSTGFNAKFGQPFLLDAPVRCFPDIRFVIAHAAYPWTLEALEMTYMFDNIYLDFSCGLGLEAWNLIEKLRPSRINWKKFLFGSDTAGLAESFVSKWKQIAKHEFFAPHADDFFYGNAAHLLENKE